LKTEPLVTCIFIELCHVFGESFFRNTPMIKNAWFYFCCIDENQNDEAMNVEMITDGGIEHVPVGEENTSADEEMVDDRSRLEAFIIGKDGILFYCNQMSFNFFKSFLELDHTFFYYRQILALVA
jgi:hypothetical protein